MTIVNLTPHPLTLMGEDGTTRVLPSSGVVLLAMHTRSLGQVDRYPLTVQQPGEISGLPAPLPGVVYVVSALVAQAVPNREDVVAPDTGPSAVRDAEGQILAVRGFVRFSGSPSASPGRRAEPRRHRFSTISKGSFLPLSVRSKSRS